jgi:RNA polymerase sigma-70 factor (ECF subfamily)
MSDDPNGNHEKFMRLFMTSEPELLRYILSTIPSVVDAREVLQETAAALWRKMNEYDTAMPFTPWACRFAANEIRAFLRRENRQRRWLDEDVAELLRVHQDNRVDAARPQIDHLRECLEALPQAQHELLRRYYFEELSVDSIARALNRTAEAVYKTMQRSRETLADCLRRKEGVTV